MASITRCGTCVPPGPSRKIAGRPLADGASAGNCERTQARSIAVEGEDEVCSAIGMTDILIKGDRSGEKVPERKFREREFREKIVCERTDARDDAGGRPCLRWKALQRTGYATHSAGMGFLFFSRFASSRRIRVTRVVS